MLQIAGELKEHRDAGWQYPILQHTHQPHDTPDDELPPRSRPGIEPLAQRLYALSSLLPERYNQSISLLMGTDASSTKRKRGLVVNADMATLIKTIEIGTPTNISNNL